MMDLDTLKTNIEKLVATQECAMLSDAQYSDIQSLRDTALQLCEQGKRAEVYTVFTEIREIISAGASHHEVEIASATLKGTGETKFDHSSCHSSLAEVNFTQSGLA